MGCVAAFIQYSADEGIMALYTTEGQSYSMVDVYISPTRCV